MTFSYGKVHETADPPPSKKRFSWQRGPQDCLMTVGTARQPLVAALRARGSNELTPFPSEYQKMRPRFRTARVRHCSSSMRAEAARRSWSLPGMCLGRSLSPSERSIIMLLRTPKSRAKTIGAKRVGVFTSCVLSLFTYGALRIHGFARFASLMRQTLPNKVYYDG